jgi:hypothetical protein
MSAAPGRPKQASAGRGTRPAFVPSKSAQADLEPRPSAPSGDRGADSCVEGLQ